MKLPKRLLAWVVIAGILCMAVPGSAQGQWTVLAYTDFMGFYGQILELTADSSRYLDTPETAPRIPFGPGSNVGVETTDVSLSPDGRWLAVVKATNDGSAAEVVIGDVLHNACCWYFQPIPEVYAIDLAGFDPTSTRLAMSYVGEGENGEPFAGGMMIIPTQLYEDTVPQTVSMSMQTPLLPELPAGIWARMGRWEADGIRFSPLCYACDAGFMGEYSIWNPDTNTFLAHSGEFFTGFGERLDSTGEMIFAANDTNYVSGTEPGMFPPSNVIRYSPNGAIDEANSYVVFADPRLLDIGEVHWVLDGRAVLIVSLDLWVLLYRDGTVREVGGTRGHYFFAGTPDGWVTRSGDEEGNITVWHWTETGRTQIAMYGAGTSTLLLRSAPLGTGLTPQAFPLVPPPSPEQLLTQQVPLPPADETMCPGAPAPRLNIGGSARVTPGEPNRVRDLPTLTGSRVLGQIPGGQYFIVLDGPVCEASTGINWWLVRQATLEGWTAEGQGNTYFLEPAS
jgi:hypothetical protein